MSNSAIQVYYTQYVLNDPILLSYMGFFSMAVSSSAYFTPTAVRAVLARKVYIGGLLIWAVVICLTTASGDIRRASWLLLFGILGSHQQPELGASLDMRNMVNGVQVSFRRDRLYRAHLRKMSRVGWIFPGWMLLKLATY